jgi:sulfite exporter TauE/SafE
MCGGIVSALGIMRQRAVGSLRGIKVTTAQPVVAIAKRPRLASSALLSVSLYNIGRIATYTTLGALAGAAGSMAWMMNSVLPVQQSAYVITSVLLMLMGLYVIGLKQMATVVESVGAVLWNRISPLATRSLSRSGVVNSLLAGSLWGLVPCGMVYAVLSAALVSGSAAKGALLMFVFGLGTLPNLMLLGMSGQWLARASRNSLVRRCVGLMIIGFGVFGLMHVVMMPTP